MARLASSQSFDPALVRGSDAFLTREFPMTATNFQLISAIAHKGSGIVLTEAKQQMVYSRLARRLRALGMTSFDQYLTAVVHNEGREYDNFLNAITTNLTSFFRENHHFDYLKSTVVPLLKLRNASTRKIRIWCTAASTGEEPYSIAMVLKECAGSLVGWDIQILATDIDSEVIAAAQRGVFSRHRIEHIPPARQQRWFGSSGGQDVEVDCNLRSMIQFRQLNLLDRWPMIGPFDAVFCRNVIIYFDKDTQRALFSRIHKVMRPGGHLFIGHSESLMQVSDQFETQGGTIYLAKYGNLS